MESNAPTPETDRLAAWEAREAAVRHRPRHYGVATREQVAGLSGMQVLERMLAGELPAALFSETLGFVLVEAAPGRAVFQGRPARAHYNPLGSVHGGWFATLLDSAVGCAVHSMLPVGKAYTTVELKINMVRALTDRMPLVEAEGKVIHFGGRLATADGRLTGVDGKLYAHASTTCFLFDAP